MFIFRYNRRAKLYQEQGLPLIQNLTVVVSVNEESYHLDLVSQKPSPLFPTYDSCDKEGDPKEGCLKIESLYFNTSIPVKTDTLDLYLFDSIHEDVFNATIPVESSKKYLKRICYRLGSPTESVIDVPPEWDLRFNTTEGGCEFGNNWKPYHYDAEKSNSIIIEARYFMDPFIAASSLTRGCNERETNRDCFGLSHNEMSTYGLYAIIAAGVVTGLEFITLLSMCLCCRSKLPCCNKDYDELNLCVCSRRSCSLFFMPDLSTPKGVAKWMKVILLILLKG